MSRIELFHGDITKLPLDAIVNAANRSLLGGGGVDGAIHRAAGPGLLEECIRLNGCDTGQARITKGYDLPARFVIHTVGPVWKGGKYGEEQLLSDCYRRSLQIARQYCLRSIAFPNISTGVYRFPKEIAACIALEEVMQFLENDPDMEKVIFACHDEENFELYHELLYGKLD